MAISSPVSTLMQVYTFPYCPSPAAREERDDVTLCKYKQIITRADSVKGFTDSLTYLVAPLPLEGDLPQAHVHDVVVGLGCVAHLADDVALLHDGIAFFLKGADGATHRLHGALTCRRV